MANFNTHITVAAAGSLLATGICLQTAHLTQAESAALFAMGTLAGLLPDIDSDHSLPAQWIFSLLSLATALLILFGWQGKLPLWQLLACAAAGAVVMRYIILKLFTRITVHRGLFHSLPAALLAGLATVVLGQHLMGWSLDFTWLAAAFITCGYLLHLLLDEMFSVNLMGSSLKQSFGTALTLFAPAAWPAYLLLYSAVLAGIVLLPMPRFISAAIPRPLESTLDESFNHLLVMVPAW